MQSTFINLKLDSALEQGALKLVSTDTGQRATGAAFTCTAACLQGAIYMYRQLAYGVLYSLAM